VRAALPNLKLSTSTRNCSMTPEVESIEGIGGVGLAGLDFDSMECGAGFDDGVDLMAFPATQEADGGKAAGVGGGFRQR
jgi:hypothetical protein